MPIVSATTRRVHGSIRDLKSGFGFITTDGGDDVFFHKSRLRPGRYFNTLRLGLRVSFTPIMEERGPAASDLEIEGMEALPPFA